MTKAAWIPLALVLGCGLAAMPAAAQMPQLEEAAQRLTRSTVTVRVIPAPAAPGIAALTNADTAGPAAPQVSVCSGVSVGGGMVVTYVPLEAQSQIRVTLTGGDQARAEVRVADHYSGLTLLETDKPELPAVELADEVPAVGSWVLTAAAWGAERPVVSFGILSGAERSIRGASFPPLLQCDVRTAETSSGSGVVDQQGRLVGVVVGVEAPGQRNGWTYAVPVAHVKRMLRAKVDGKTVVLKLRRPEVGMVLESGEDPSDIRVQRVTPGGPAEKAGIRAGDRILAADGIHIRSVYQAVAPVTRKQPGDSMTFLVHQATGLRTIEVTLGGGIELPPAPPAANIAPGGLVDPRVVVSRVGPNRFDLQAADGLRNLSVEPAAAGPPADPRLELLERAIDRYRSAIVYLQSELNRRTQQDAANQETIEALKAQIAELTQQLEAVRSSQRQLDAAEEPGAADPAPR